MRADKYQIYSSFYECQKYVIVVSHDLLAFYFFKHLITFEIQKMFLHKSETVF